MLKTGAIIAVEVYQTYNIGEQRGWIIPYETFQTENILMEWEEEWDEGITVTVALFDCFVSILISAYKIDFNRDNSVKSFETNNGFFIDYTPRQCFAYKILEEAELSIHFSEDGRINPNKSYVAKVITLPDELKQLPYFNEKGYYLYRIG